MEGKKRKNYSNIATQKQLEKKVLQKKRREKNLTRTQIRKFETFHFPLRRPMMHFPSRNQFRSDRNLTFSIDSGILDYDIAWWYQGLIRSSINFNSETRLSFDGEFRLSDRSSREGNERDIVGFWPFMNFLVKGSVGIWSGLRIEWIIDMARGVGISTGNGSLKWRSVGKTLLLLFVVDGYLKKFVVFQVKERFEL